MHIDIGAAGSIIGALVGVAGGLTGTFFSIRNTNGPRERAFMSRAAMAGWVTLGVFFAVMLLVPGSRFWTGAAGCLLLPAGIRYGNRRQMTLRQEEHPDT